MIIAPTGGGSLTQSSGGVSGRAIAVVVFVAVVYWFFVR